jgi:hypothetical protein
MVNVLTGKAVAAEAITAEIVKKLRVQISAMPESNEVEKTSKVKEIEKMKALTRVGGILN